ncbi:MAG: tetratricopeptide repeat protein, partial [Pyrinomonadaceae bacterium]
SGETVNHTIVSILEREPQRLEKVPDELQRIVRKSLTKDVDMRYQSAHDLLIDLKNLRRDLDIKGELERSDVPNRETVSETSSENATQFYTADAETTRSGQVAATQNITTSSSSLEYAVTQAKSHKFTAAIIGLLLLGVISAVAYFGFLARTNAKQIESIAVMPFINESGNPDVEYLSDGMTETLISSLSQVPNLNVKGRSTVFRYKGKDADPKTLGRELNVQAVLNGRVLQRGESLTLSLELLDTTTENVIWSERYNRRSTDLVSLQSEIARDVSQKLKTKLTGADEQKIAKSHTTDPEAYQLYLKGIFYWNKRTGDNLKRSIEYFDQAIAKDPSYALAHAGLALAYVLLPDYHASTVSDSYPQAKRAAQRALELDASLAEAHTAFGYVLEFDENIAAGEAEFQKAIQLNPNYPTAHQWYGNNLQAQGRLDEAEAELKRALELDPLSRIIRENLGENYHFSGKYDLALQEGKELLEIDPNFFLAHSVVGRAYQMKGMFPEAFASFTRAKELNDDPNFYMADLASLYADWGKRDEAIRILEETKQAATRRYISPYTFAVIYAALGDKDAAIESLEQSYRTQVPLFKYVAVHQVFKGLRSDPRFSDLLRRAGLSK